MNQQQANKLTASVFRQLFLLKMLHTENHFFLKQPAPSGIKNALSRGCKAFEFTLNDLCNQLPLSREKLKTEVKVSEEKILAISTILEKLSMLDESQVLEIENQFDKSFKIQY
jgi:hypothetical protein